MGLFDRIKQEFIDIIEWTDNSTDTIVWKFPRYKNEIKMGSQLTVRESQEAIFLNEGQLADVFKPGMHSLSTENMPILATLKGWKYGFNSPFKADVFFVNTKQFTNQKWGTKNPVMLRDAEFGPIRIRAFGNYAFKIMDSALFLKSIVGTNSDFSVEEVNEHLKNLIITRGVDAIAESKIPILDLASNYDEVSKVITEKLNLEFKEIGVTLTKLLIENISLPPEVEKALDKRSSMGIIGDLNDYSKFQSANAIEKAAESDGNGGNMMQAGLGAGLGMSMMNQMNNSSAQNSSNAPKPPPLPVVQYYVGVNGKQLGPFDMNQIQVMVKSNQISRSALVWREGMTEWEPAEKNSDISKLFSAMPPPLPPSL